MVKEKLHNNKKYYKCESCEMYYLDRKIAEKCEEFCKKYHSCNIKIIKQSVKLK